MLNQFFGRITLAAALVCAGAAVGCKAVGGAEGDSPSQQRSTIQSEAESTLAELYAAKPGTKEKVRNACGWGYFSNTNVHVLLLSTENGYGVVHNNATGKDTYMKMAGAGGGLGMGAKDYRAIFIFTDRDVMRRFVTSGWDFGGSADAAATANNKGGAADAAASAGSVAGMEVYQFTKTGLALQATLQGSKYWTDDSLNR